MKSIRKVGIITGVNKLRFQIQFKAYITKVKDNACSTDGILLVYICQHLHPFVGKSTRGGATRAALLAQNNQLISPTPQPGAYSARQTSVVYLGTFF